MFSGGTYEEVGRWLRMFMNSHAKREDPRIEAELDTGGERRGRSYGAWLVLFDRRSDLMGFDYREVAASRGSLTWCAELASRIRDRAKSLLATAAARH